MEEILYPLIGRLSQVVQDFSTISMELWNQSSRIFCWKPELNSADMRADLQTHTHVSAILRLASSEPVPSIPHGSLYSQHCGTAPGFVFLPRCCGAVGQKLIQMDAPDAASVYQCRTKSFPCTP